MSEALPTKGFGSYLFDGFGALDGGVNTGPTSTVKSELVPNGLDRNQAFAATNCAMRGGNITHRFNYAQRVLTFDSAAHQSNFETGLFQGASFYEAAQSSLVASVGGRLFQIRVENNFAVKDISVVGDLNPSNLNLAWFVQLGPFLVVQDNSSVPLIFNGTSTRRAGPREIKPGSVMAVSQGRIWYATANGYAFRATDLVGNTATGTPPTFVDSGLLETENDYLNEGGDFAVPPNSGGIRAMIVPNMLDTSLGQGPLQVFTSKGAFSTNAPVDRTAWKSVTYPIQTESQIEFGALGARSTVNVNGDVFYRSLDGIRSFKLARQDFQSWLNTSVSKEVEKILLSDASTWLFWGSALNWGNRLIMTCWPRQTGQGIVHDGLITLDFDLISSLRERAPAAWEGVLTGMSVLQLVKGTFGDVTRAFAFVLSLTGKIELWELLEHEIADTPGDGVANPVNWAFETPSYDFKRAESLKRLTAAAFWLEDVQGTVEFLLQFRPDRYPCWVDWYRWSECAPVEQCFTADRTCKTIHNYKPQYRPKVKIPQPPELCNTTVGALFRDAYEFAFRIQVVGHATVKKARFACIDLGEKLFEDCVPAGPCLRLDCCPPDPAAYRIPGEGAPTGGTVPPGYPYPNWPGYPDSYPAPPTPPPPPNPFPSLDDPSPGNDPARPLPPPDPPSEVEIPVVDGWTGAWTGEFDTNYWVTKVSNDPDADISADLQDWLRAMLANEWAANPPAEWSERQLGWSFVDPVPGEGWYLDGKAKFDSGSAPFPAPGDPIAQFGAVWVLAYFWR